MKWYNKEGKEISVEEANSLLGDINYRRVAETTMPDGKWISTVWLGLDQNFGFSKVPIIFETMVFKTKVRKNPVFKGEDGNIYIDAEVAEESHDLDMERYSTLEEALKGHEEMVRKHTNI